MENRCFFASRVGTTHSSGQRAEIVTYTSAAASAFDEEHVSPARTAQNARILIDFSMPSYADVDDCQPIWPWPIRKPTGSALEEVSHALVDERSLGNLPIVDPDAANARMNGNNELLRRMVGSFAMQWRTLCDQLAGACKRLDGPALELTASRLRKSVESFGAGEVSRVAGELQMRGREGDFDDLERICARLKMAVERLVSDLTRI